MEKKYRGIIKQIKSKEKNLSQENNQLKEMINNQDAGQNQMSFGNQLQNLNLYNKVMGNNNNNDATNKSMMNMNVNKNNILNDNNNSALDPNNVNNTFNLPLNNNVVNATFRGANYQPAQFQKIEDPNDLGQKQTLEEFKMLLKKMDEKIDLAKK